jgi:hypothetical protein
MFHNDDWFSENGRRIFFKRVSVLVVRKPSNRPRRLGCRLASTLACWQMLTTEKYWIIENVIYLLIYRYLNLFPFGHFSWILERDITTMGYKCRCYTFWKSLSTDPVSLLCTFFSIRSVMAVSKTNTDSITFLSSGGNSSTWRSCSYCLNKIFKTSAEFTKYLKFIHTNHNQTWFLTLFHKQS